MVNLSRDCPDQDRARGSPEQERNSLNTPVAPAKQRLPRRHSDGSMLKEIQLDFDFVELNNIYCQFNFIEVNWVAEGESRMQEDGAEKPAWLAALSSEDVQFLKRFLIASGSLKDLAQEYQVSYPTIRGRLDRLIAKVRVAEDPKITDPFVRKVRMLVADGALPQALARELLEAHRESRRGRS